MPRLPQAREAWQLALAIFEDIQHPDADQVRAKLASADAADVLTKVAGGGVSEQASGASGAGIAWIVIAAPVRAVSLLRWLGMSA